MKKIDKFKDPNICQNRLVENPINVYKARSRICLPHLKSYGNIYCDDEQKADKLNDLFTQQTILDEHNASLPQTMTASLNNLMSFRITSDEVESTLLSLPTGKALRP